ncbi:hypothetical protein ALC62_01571 [Cyphomyrmex costatus]|uniref:Uncharacterized protein n=1 Tax=Cyphomyrmex costatus TaxID=456900 RepID=A0A195D4L3_9HYME|nr:hypothetical protein ALC62_01571 [Cyphomyrmex costatus]
MRKESRFGWNDELFPGLSASLPSFSLFLSSSLTILKFRPHGEHGGHDESVHANSTEPVRVS